MVGKPDRGKRLTGSELGYHGKGVPDPQTIGALQTKYFDALVAGELRSEIRAKLVRMRSLADTALRGHENHLLESEIARAFDEFLTISSELAPLLHFKEDEVDWTK